ncbi:hypothetical protein BDV96DRAFT_585036 [Lophiotrema nucula]|uniref:MARVEL domain-containing protein n=1 Tax=Lophiotrema nucula TaxID=690887 RepID=A0A6A5YT03_9PLEO|nr:hypothetical protein BDV96DRAFT_585036 [Lophiotrema nucula]
MANRSGDASAPAQSRDLGSQMIRTLGLFQALVSFPIGLVLGSFDFAELLFPYVYYGYYYYFVTYLFTCLMALGITFIVITQRRTVLDNTKRLVFEGVKSGLATGLWLWLLMDSLFGPWQYFNDRDVAERKAMRVAYTLTAIVPLVLLFYTSLVYAHVQWKLEKKYGERRDEERPNEREEDGTGEREPLLTRSS